MHKVDDAIESKYFSTVAHSVKKRLSVGKIRVMQLRILLALFYSLNSWALLPENQPTINSLQNSSPFTNICNFRDVAHIPSPALKPGRLYRSGYFSDASLSDLSTLLELNIKTFIDLRSPEELRVDSKLYSSTYMEYETIDLNKEDSLEIEIESVHLPIKKQRVLLCLISERAYLLSIVRKSKLLEKLRLVSLLCASFFSNRAKSLLRLSLLKKISEGGLLQLNELILQECGAYIARVLKIVADENRHPVAISCTAGKDRTGLIIALVLMVAGVSSKYIVNDYSMSNNAYECLADKYALVAALSQRELDGEMFLQAPPEVMEGILELIDVKYGGLDKYLDEIGFNDIWRDKLRLALRDD